MSIASVEIKPGENNFLAPSKERARRSSLRILEKLKEKVIVKNDGSMSNSRSTTNSEISSEKNLNKNSVIISTNQKSAFVNQIVNSKNKRCFLFRCCFGKNK